MRIVPTHIKSIFCILAISIVPLFSYQNCSKVAFHTVDGSSVKDEGEAANAPQYVELKAGDHANFPPLKLFFVIDNSGTMQANQINLSSAFSKMFDGGNATNLAPFETTAYVLNTAQMSLPKTDSTYPKLPKQDSSYFIQMSYADLLAGPRATVLNGSVPGDLVGYRTVEETAADGSKSTSYQPAPVLGFQNTGGRTIASVGAHKTRDGSVPDFAQEFRDRVAVLDPSRSAIDPVQKKGILDSVIDKESGLCALARVLRHKQNYFNPGDMAAFVIVSDENDQDEKGVNCVDSFSTSKGMEDLIDGHCVASKTELTYRALNPNPADANCKVTFDSGFKYKYTYNLPQTAVDYFQLQYDATVRQTQVSYSVATHTYTEPKTIVSYYTKAPTYKLPQTTITYYRKVESCDSRDGVKFNCTYTYPMTTTAASSAPFSGDCKAYATGKIPADALTNDSAHPLKCQALAPIAKSGACLPTDPTVLECNQNYSSARKDSAPLAGSGVANCAAFASGKLEASAVYTDAGYQVTCRDASVNGVAGNGLCPTGGSKLNCVNTTTTAKSPAIDGVPSAATAAACMTFAKAKKGSLSTNAIFDNASYPVTCAESSGRRVVNQVGACPVSNPNFKDCTEHAAGTKTAVAYAGSPASASQTDCLAFIKANVGAVKIHEASAVTCAVSATPKVITSAVKDMLYSNTAVANFTASQGANCLAAMKDFVTKTDGVPSPASCTVTSVNKADYSYNLGKTCEMLPDDKAHCASSGGARRNCVASSVQAGDMYLPTTTSVVQAGDFTCDTLCRDTGFCQTKSGTVGDNYKDCRVTPKSTNRTFVGKLLSQKASLCQAGENPQPVITKGPYRDAGDRTDYVAGASTENREPNALAKYIRDSSQQLFGSTLPAVSVFVRQPGDSVGVNGSEGTAYNAFAEMMGGQKRSVLGNADSYATSLQSLSSAIRGKLDRSFSAKVGPRQTIHQIWHRKPGSTDWGAPVDPSNWSASGGTVTLDSTYQFEYGDEFRFEYY